MSASNEKVRELVRTILFFLLIGVLAVSVSAAPEKANYDLASRWTPAKVAKLVFDLSVEPHWLKNGDRFWYSYETP
ncbi:MAG: hypothetical protein ACPLRA_01210, partial [Candidatus Saccharicenans sp.]